MIKVNNYLDKKKKKKKYIHHIFQYIDHNLVILFLFLKELLVYLLHLV